MYIDTHAHLEHPPFDLDRDAVLSRAVAAGVERIIVVGTTLAGSQAALELARANPRLFATVGIHPNHAAEAAADDWNSIVALAADPCCVGLGETGLDRYWQDTPFPMQQDYFARHLELSRRTALPVVIHTRDSLADTLEMLRAERRSGPLRGVLHSYTGDAESAAECVELGLYISFAGMVTFKKNDVLRNVAKTIPAERILIETDSPYLAPQPVRGQRNEPAHVVHTAACLAEARGTPLAEFAAQTTANALALFGLAAARS